MRGRGPQRGGLSPRKFAGAFPGKLPACPAYGTLLSSRTIRPSTPRACFWGEELRLAGRVYRINLDAVLQSLPAEGVRAAASAGRLILGREAPLGPHSVGPSDAHPDRVGPEQAEPGSLGLVPTPSRGGAGAKLRGHRPGAGFGAARI